MITIYAHRDTMTGITSDGTPVFYSQAAGGVWLHEETCKAISRNSNQRITLIWVDFEFEEA